MRTFRAHHDIDRHRMIPEELNRAIFEIHSKGSWRERTVYSNLPFWRKVSKELDGMVASKRYHETGMSRSLLRDTPTCMESEVYART